MAMTKEEVFETFRYYASKEFEDIPENESEIECEFSDEFNKKMEKLLKRVSYDRTHIVSWAGKKIIIVAAIIALMLSGMMSVGAIREPVVEFIYNIYEEFTEIFFDGDTTDKITYRYSLSEIPEGFVETHQITNESVNIVEYENINNNDISSRIHSLINKIKELNLRSKIIAQVHDELVIDTVLDEVEIVKKILKKF